VKVFDRDNTEFRKKPMAKKNKHDARALGEPTAVEAPAVLTSSEPIPQVDIGGLAEEVSSFIAQRDSLSQRLAEEIAATEKKLAELKHTAAMLFPKLEQAQSVETQRKPKAARQIKATKASSQAVNPDLSSRTLSSEAGRSREGEQASAPHEPHLD
jgi:hypothetical protein